VDVFSSGEGHPATKTQQSAPITLMEYTFPALLFLYRPRRLGHGGMVIKRMCERGRVKCETG